ncbi:MAG: Ig-like domain-containing protein [Ignavibacteriaceae bacterium]|nr:Ig-like domain-containing protein [Ignavibacteriaceae bacterium]
MSYNIIKYFLLLLLGFLLSDCANQLPPGGGEVDKVPPVITEISPPDGTTNYKEDYFELTFSKYVEKRSLKDAIFISPAINGNIELDWSGHSVRVIFPQKLKDSTTYVITIGTDLVDYNNKNRMAQSVTFSFSTGNKVDKKIISGKVFEEKPSGILIFAYKKGKEEPNPMKVKPDYISQVGNDGRYKIIGLAEGDYRVFAVYDQYRDFLFQPEQDKIGMPSKDVLFSEKDTLFSNLNFFLTKIDTSAPRILSSVMTDKMHILVNFTEPLDPSCMRSNNFFVYDSTTQKRTPMLFAYKGNTKPTEIVLVTSHEIPESNSCWFFADSIKDMSGNKYMRDFAQLTVSTKPDTAKLDFYKYSPPNRTDHADFLDQKFTFYLNDGVDSNQVKNIITFTDTSRIPVDFNIRFIDDATFQIESLKPLETRKDYIIMINLSRLTDAAGNKRDSVYQYKFKTIAGSDFTGISGVLNNVNLDKRPVLVLQGIDGDKIIYTQFLSNNNRFNIDRVTPGKYSLWAYLDVDKNNSYSYGTILPFKPAEEFSFYPDTLDLKARWVQSDLIFNFK